MSTHTLTHPLLGQVKGSTDKAGLIQYLGIQYATLADRLAPSRLATYTGNGEIDATHMAPSVLGQPNGADFEQKIMQHTLEYDRSLYTRSDINGLNLYMTTPKQSTGTASLPVLCFIHGGAFQNGSASFPQYDMARLVSLSLENGTPIIAIAISYRTAVPGFLTSSELRAAGYKPNNALRDQRNALLWVQKYIQGFGGDPQNVTLMGESAGAISSSYHLESKDRLFTRVMCMSGTSLLMPPLPIAAAERNYALACKTLGLDGLSAEERVKALVSMDAEEFRTKLVEARVVCMSVVDDEILCATPTYQSVADGSHPIHGRDWCQAAIIGDCQFDGMIHGLRLLPRKAGIAAAFTTSLTASLGSEAADTLCKAYHLEKTTPDDPAFLAVLQILSDITFYAPTVPYIRTLARAMPVYVYRFNEPNPWPGAWQGYPLHIQDLVWLLMNFEEFLDAPQRAQGRAFAASVIRFANGHEPWRPWDEEEKAACVLREGRVEMASDEPAQVGRRSVVLELGESGMDALHDAAEKFMRGG